MGRLRQKIGHFIRNKMLPKMMRAGTKVSKVVSRVPVIGKIAGPVATACSNFTNKLTQKAIDYGNRRAAEREARNGN